MERENFTVSGYADNTHGKREGKAASERKITSGSSNEKMVMIYFERENGKEYEKKNFDFGDDCMFCVCSDRVRQQTCRE